MTCGLPGPNGCETAIAGDVLQSQTVQLILSSRSPCVVSNLSDYDDFYDTWA